MNIREISKATDIPYSTTRKYLLLLEQANVINSRLKDGERIFPDSAAEQVLLIARLSGEGVPLADAVEHIKSGEVKSKERLTYLEQQIEKLTRNVITLSELLQIQLAENRKERQPALPGKGGPFYHLGQFFRGVYRWLLSKPGDATENDNSKE